MSTINGSLAAFQNRETYSFTPGQGGTYGGKYEGPSAAILAKFNTLLGLGYHVVYECDSSPIATVTFDTPNSSGNPSVAPTDPNSDFTDSFQVARNTVQKELLLSDHPLVSCLNATNLGELKKYVLTPSNFLNDGDDFEPAGGNPSTVMTSLNAANYLWALFESGVRSVEVKQPVLRVTRVTNPLYDRPFDLSRVDRVLNTATMIADSGVPSNFAVQLAELANGFIDPDTMVGGVRTGFKLRSDGLQLYYGWLKDTITSETVGTTRNQYVIEYKFGLYDLYSVGFRV